MFITRQYHRHNQVSGTAVDEEISHNWIVDDIFVNKDLSTAIGWSITLPYMVTMDEMTRADLFTKLRGTFNALPENYDIQIVWTLQHDFNDVLQAIRSQQPNAPILKAYQEEQLQLIRSRAANGFLRRYRAYIFLVRKCSLKSGDFGKRTAALTNEAFRRHNSNPGLFGNIKHTWKQFAAQFLDFSGTNLLYQHTEKEWDDLKKELFTQANSMEVGLVQCGLAPKVLLDNDLLHLLYYWWNPISHQRGLRPPSFQPTKKVPVTDYYLQNPFIWDPKTGHFELDGALHRILTLRQPPEAMDLGQINPILLGANYMTAVCNITSMSVEKRIARLNDELPLIRSRVAKDPKLLPVYHQISSEIIALAEGNERVWQASHTFHIWDTDAGRLDAVAMNIKQLGLRADGASIVQEEHALWEYWRASQPIWTTDKDRYRHHIYNTSQLLNMLPMLGQRERLEAPLGVLLETTLGGIYNLQMFDQKNLNNYNTILIGTSGTGKSFLASSIMAQLQRDKARVIAIDLGGSYKGLCNALNGNYINMDIDSTSQTINPLYFPPGYVPENSDIERILLFIEKMIVDPAVGKGRLEKNRINNIDEALRQLIVKSEGKEMFLSGLHAILDQYDAPSADVLRAWIGNGRYGKLFDGATKIDMNNPFTVFDFSLVKDSRDVAPLALMSIMNAVQAMAARYPNDVKLLLIDEAWFMLSDPIAGRFMAECFRTYRKTGTGILGISQGIEEWTKIGGDAETAGAILNNTSTYMILRQSNAASAQKAGDVINLNAMTRGLIGSLETVPGSYSQGLIYQTRSDGSNESMVFINRPTPLLYAMCTTNKKDTAKIDELGREGVARVEGYSKVDALTEFSRRYPNGTMNAAN